MGVGIVEPAAAESVAASAARPPQISWRLARRVAVWFVIFMVTTNLFVVVLSRVASAVTDMPRPSGVDAVEKLYVVDRHVWRSAHPDPEGYASLAAAGVTTVVDLRAERDASDSDPLAESAGLSVVHLPIRDGQVPSDEQVDRFVGIVERAEGVVLVHCGAGVGRTGAMAAAYLTETGQTSGSSALVRNLAVGPPSIEQMWYAASDDAGRPAAVIAVSRLLDAPRRLLSWF